MEPFRERLWKRYMKLKGFLWDGYKSPEQCPDIQSGQVLALAEMVEELEGQVLEIGNGMLELLNRLGKRIEVLEGLE